MQQDAEERACPSLGETTLDDWMVDDYDDPIIDRFEGIDYDG